MIAFRAYLAEQMQDPEFRAEYEALAPEFALIEAIISARKNAGLSQEQLAEKTGMTISDINEIELGDTSPPLNTLQRLAAGLDMQVRVELLPAG